MLLQCIPTKICMPYTTQLHNMSRVEGQPQATHEQKEGRYWQHKQDYLHQRHDFIVAHTHCPRYQHDRWTR